MEVVGLREYADPWVQNRHNRSGQPLKARSEADYRRLLKAKIYPTFGDVELKDITTSSPGTGPSPRLRPNRPLDTPSCGRS